MAKTKKILCGCCDRLRKQEHIVYQKWNNETDTRVGICWSCSDILDYVQARTQITCEALAIVFTHLNELNDEERRKEIE